MGPGKREQAGWHDLWNLAIEKLPLNPVGDQRLLQGRLLRYVLHVSQDELREIRLGQAECPAAVMTRLRMIAGGDGKTWLKVWLRDYEGAGLLVWHGGEPVFPELTRRNKTSE